MSRTSNPSPPGSAPFSYLTLIGQADMAFYVVPLPELFGGDFEPQFKSHPSLFEGLYFSHGSGPLYSCDSQIPLMEPHRLVL
jgi:hypothetical protein